VLIDPGHHLGDAWFHVDDNVAHCFYLRCPDDVPRHAAWEIARATSLDLRTWELHGTVVERTAPHRGAGRCLATGSVLRVDDGYLMAFTDGWAERAPTIRFATSPDLASWTEDPVAAIEAGAPGYAVDRPVAGRPSTHWRDPFLRTHADGAVEALISAARTDAPDDASGAVARAVRSVDGTWTVGAPLEVEPVAREVECPQVREIDGRWFLVFSTWPPLFADELRARRGGALRPGTYAMVGDGPDGPFELAVAEPIVAADHPLQPYAGQLVRHRDAWHLLGTLWRHGHPDAVSDPIPVRRAGDRLLAG
jgi:beta-fructofuranosidase